ncbi:hypothetical protein WA158_006716 [Blastocystis sp. Blastoise]
MQGIILKNTSRISRGMNSNVSSFYKIIGLLKATPVIGARFIHPDAVKPAIPRKKVTTQTILSKYRKGEKIACCTGYDYPAGVLLDAAGFDMILVGDSSGMGYENTLPVTMEDMIHNCKSVTRGAHASLVVGDMPFGSYEVSKEDGLRNALRFMKEGFVDAIKLEGGKKRAETVRHIVDAGIAVQGHIGLTPQSISNLGGFRVQGKTFDNAMKVIEDAIALENAGCFSVVIECVPPLVGKAITKSIHIPTIGIGSGPYVSGQILVYHDILGMLQHPHHAQATPSFCKQYAQIGLEVHKALCTFKDEIVSKQFPGNNYCSYKIPDEAVAKLETALGMKLMDDDESVTPAPVSTTNADKDEPIKVY